MLLNLLTISALIGLAACSGYGNNNNYAAANPGYGYFQPPRHHMRRNHHRRRSSSSESDEKWDCARLGVLKATGSDPTTKLFSAPKIAYYTHQGDEMAIAVCEGPQVQIIVGESNNANTPGTDVTNYPIISLSSRSGITLKCNKRKDRYEAVNLITSQTVRLEAIACVSADEDGMEKFVLPVVRGLGFIQAIL